MVTLRWVCTIVIGQVMNIVLIVFRYPYDQEELELPLPHLQQNVEFLEIHLLVHPVIQRAVEQVGSALLILGACILSLSRPTHPAYDRTFPMKR